MGSRANVAVRLNGEWTHCGSNGMGYSLDAWLALGPAPALAVIGSFPVWDRNEWQVESSCEAGAMIDLDGQDLLFFLDADYDQRLADLDGYRRTWPGWTIRWAYNGIADVTDALDLDTAVLGRKPWENTDLFHWGQPDTQEPPDLRYLVTVGDAGHGLSGWAVPPWQVGPDLLDQLTGLPQPSTWPEVPRGGLHLDPAARRAGVWSIDPVLGLADRFAERWPGWTLEFWQDRYQEQERRCAGAFRFPDPAPAVDLCGYALVRRVMQHWVRATAEFRDSWPQEQEGYDPFYALRVPDSARGPAKTRRIAPRSGPRSAPPASHPGRVAHVLDRMGDDRRLEPTPRRRRVRAPTPRSLIQRHRRRASGSPRRTCMMLRPQLPQIGRRVALRSAVRGALDRAESSVVSVFESPRRASEARRCGR